MTGFAIDEILTETGTCIRYSQTTYSEDANEDAVAAAPEEVDYPCLLQQRDPSLSDRATELRTGPATFVSSYLLFLAADAIIDGRDQWRQDGVVYEIIGDPALVRTPDGPHHIEVALRRITT